MHKKDLKRYYMYDNNLYMIEGITTLKYEVSYIFKINGRGISQNADLHRSRGWYTCGNDSFRKKLPSFGRKISETEAEEYMMLMELQK